VRCPGEASRGRAVGARGVERGQAQGPRPGPRRRVIGSAGVTAGARGNAPFTRGGASIRSGCWRFRQCLRYSGSTKRSHQSPGPGDRQACLGTRFVD
jgi:hypothetical protein